MASQVPRSIKAILGDNIRAARADAEITQSELARRLGVESMAVSRWERGAVRPSDANLQALGAVLDRDIAWFYGDHSQEQVA